MIRAYTPDQVRAAERPLLEQGVPLMHRAAAGIAARTAPVLRERHGRLPGSRLVLLVGPGSNGGDALHAGAWLAARGAQVTAIPTSDRLHEDGATALRRAGGRILEGESHSGAVPAAEPILGRAHVILDGVLGIGARPELSADLARLLEAADAACAPVLAVDVPTGVDARTGQAAPGAVHAALTLTAGAVKAGLLLPGAAEHVGRVELIDIGLSVTGEAPPVRRLEDEDVRELWPVPARSDHKYSRGVVAIDAGSPDFPGAGVLSSAGAARAGAGMVRYRGPAAVRDLILAVHPEIVGTDGRHDALVIGSGLPPEDPRCRAGVEELLGPDGRGVIDAGAIGAITPEDAFGPGVVLTPHAGEAAKLAERLGVDAEAPAGELASALARATGATILLKGSVSVVAPGDAPERLFAQDDGTPWLGTAGTGDVLGGILGALLAAGLPGPEAAALAALVHGRAGRAASRGGVAPLLAQDVAENVPAVLAAILGGAVPPGTAGGGA